MCRTEGYHHHFSKCGHTAIVKHVYICPPEQRNRKKKKYEKTEMCSTSRQNIYSSTHTSECTACEVRNTERATAWHRKTRAEKAVTDRRHLGRSSYYDWSGGSSSARERPEREYQEQLRQIQIQYNRELGRIESDHARNLQSLYEKHYHNE